MVVSDTNILGSFAAADALPSLFGVLLTDVITIPPAVEAEIQAGVVRGAAHLQQLLDMVTDGRLVVVTLDEPALALAATLPRKLNTGEREAIGLAAQQQAVLLTNDRRALNYCTMAWSQDNDLVICGHELLHLFLTFVILVAPVAVPPSWPRGGRMMHAIGVILAAAQPLLKYCATFAPPRLPGTVVSEVPCDLPSTRLPLGAAP